MISGSLQRDVDGKNPAPPNFPHTHTDILIGFSYREMSKDQGP